MQRAGMSLRLREADGGTVQERELDEIAIGHHRHLGALNLASEYRFQFTRANALHHVMMAGR